MSDQISKQLSFRYFYLWWFIGLVMILLVLYFSLTSNPPVLVEAPFIDKLEHLLAYSGLMGWYCQLYTSRSSQVAFAIFFSSMGVSLEVIQGWGGYRYFEYADMMANTLGVLLGWCISSRLAAGMLVRIDRVLSR